MVKPESYSSPSASSLKAFRSYPMGRFSPFSSSQWLWSYRTGVTLIVSRSIRTLLLICFFIINTSILHHVHAQDLSQLEPGVPFAQDKWIQYQEQSASAQVHDQSPLSIDDLNNRPDKLIAALKRNPKRLNVDQMVPEIALEISRVLLVGGEIQKSVKLLNDARIKWPNNESILQGWTRIMMNLGTSSYAVKPLEKSLKKNPTSSYNRYLYALCIFLEAPKQADRIQTSINQLELLLQNDPTYVGPDGISASQIRKLIDNLGSSLNR